MGWHCLTSAGRPLEVVVLGTAVRAAQHGECVDLPCRKAPDRENKIQKGPGVRPCLGQEASVSRTAWRSECPECHQRGGQGGSVRVC